MKQKNAQSLSMGVISNPTNRPVLLIHAAAAVKSSYNAHVVDGASDLISASQTRLAEQLYAPTDSPLSTLNLYAHVCYASAAGIGLDGNGRSETISVHAVDPSAQMLPSEAQIRDFWINQLLLPLQIDDQELSEAVNRFIVVEDAVSTGYTSWSNRMNEYTYMAQEAYIASGNRLKQLIARKIGPELLDNTARARELRNTRLGRWAVKTFGNSARFDHQMADEFSNAVNLIGDKADIFKDMLSLMNTFYLINPDFDGDFSQTNIKDFVDGNRAAVKEHYNLDQRQLDKFMTECELLLILNNKKCFDYIFTEFANSVCVTPETALERLKGSDLESEEKASVAMILSIPYDVGDAY